MTDNSYVLRQQTIVTLASALIMSRGSTSIEDAQIALEDANHLLHPNPDKEEYRKWQESRGQTPLSEEELKRRQEKLARTAASLGGFMGR